MSRTTPLHNAPQSAPDLAQARVAAPPPAEDPGRPSSHGSAPRAFRFLSSEQGIPAIDVQHLPRNETGTREVCARGRDFVDVPDPPHRDLLHPVAIAVAEMRVL